MIVCSFSSGVAELKVRDRTPQNILDALRKNPRVSCFDMSEKKWLRDMIGMLVASGRLVDDKTEPYPWIRYAVKEIVSSGNEATQPERDGRGT